MLEHQRETPDTFPLSLNQRNIWALERSVPRTSINNISATVRIEGRVDFVLLQQALQLVLRLDASLRTRVTLRNGDPVQYHAPYAEAAAPVLDFPAANEDGFSHWAEAYAKLPIFALDEPLYRFVVCRTGERSACLLVETHHIISDGWSQILLCNRIGEAYLALLNGGAPDWTEFPDYRDYVEQEQAYLRSDAYKTDREYWRAVLGQAGEAATVKAFKSAAVSHVGRRRSYRLPQQLNHAIYSFSREHRVAPFAVFYMALGAYLKRAGGGDKFTIGVPVFNRSNFRQKQTTGMFVSTLPLVNEVSEDWNFETFNEKLADRWLELLRHQRFPFSHMEELAGTGEPLFHVMLSYQDSQMLESRDASVRISGLWHYSGFQVEQLCIHLTNLEDNRVYCVDYDYLTQLFSQREIDELHQYLCHILAAGLLASDAPLHALPILGAEERERVLYRFNQSDAPRSDCTPYAMFEKTAAQNPCRAAVIHNDVRISYQALKERGARVAAALPEPGALAAVLLPRDPRLFSALVGIMQANCAWLLLSPEQPARRIEEILRQSGAACLLSIPALSAPLENAGLPIVNVDALESSDPAVRPGRPEDLAYVVYTSGSTGVPKGVEIAQKSVVNLAMAMRPLYHGGAVLSLCNVGFDAFLLESAIALLCGKTVLLPDDAQRENPEALARLILGYGVDFLSTTPSRLSAMLNHPAFSQALRRLGSIVCGGEAFPSELLHRLKGCTDAHIYNQYGPSETTVAVSVCRLDDAARITIGAPMENCRLYVLDDDLQPLPVGICGELYVGGVCVGRGYRNAPELTARSFLPNPFRRGETLYKTGDVACWAEDGQMELAGRRDQQVKLRGLRIEPQEIAACLCRHGGVTAAAARVTEQNGQPVLVGYYVSPRPIPEMELLTFAAAYLPHYMIPSRVLRVEEIPLTSNGKLDERRLPEPAAETPCLQPETPRQEQILEIFRQVLEDPSLYADSNYFLSGGNSLNAMETISRLEERFGVRLMISDLYACRTAKALDSFLALGAAESGEAPLGPAPARDAYPLSETQKSIYMQTCLNEDGLAYHMPCAFALTGEPDIPRLERAFCALLADDPLFRTHFAMRDGELAAIVEGRVSFQLPVMEADSRQEVFSRFLRPFALSQAPLLRAALWKEPAGPWLLLVDIHHIISDGLSTPMLLERLSALYGGEALAPHLTHHDYVWYCAHRDGGGEEAALSYWTQRLTGVPPLLELPADRPRPQSFDYRGATVCFSLSQAASEAAERFCARQELTPYMLFAGALGVLFARLSGQPELVIGTPVSRRNRPELRAVCGPLMGTLPLRLRPQGTVSAYFQEVRQAVLSMLDHADCPLEALLTALNLPRSTAHNPLYQVLFQIRPLDTRRFRLGDGGLEYIPIPTGTAKLDLNIEAAKLDGRYQLFFEYAASLFEPETIAFYARCLETLLPALADAPPETPVERLELLSPGDRLRCLERPRRTVVPYLDLPIHRVIEEEALLHPEDDAVLWHGERISFAALETRAGQIAGVLASRGVRPGDRVGLCCRREPELLASLLAILKCGAAYVPFLADYPAARVAYMMETADVRVILCDEATAAQLPPEAQVRPVVRGNEQAAPLADSCCPSGSDPMYILFTSGSTGKPKGVQLPHRALSNLLQSLNGWMDQTPGPALCITNVTFDIFITETLLALAQGRAVVLADEEEMLLPWKLAELIAAHQPRIAQFTPSRLQMCLNNSAFSRSIGGLAFTILVGEMVTPMLTAQFKEHCQGRLVNMYGPTEAAVYVTAGELFSDEPVTIGVPLGNCRVYVLDGERKPVLPTARGELYLAGPCLADGYAARPELTAELFVPDPFFPGERMYRSGDIGRLRMDGRLECLGRTDAQIKINGNRVELGEITDALLAAGAEQAAAVPRKNPDGSTTLYAMVSPAGLDLAALKHALSRRLPPYMLPARFLTLPQIPHNASGKVDLPLLRQMAERDAAGGGTADMPLPERTSALSPNAEPAAKPEPPRANAEPEPPPKAEPAPRADAVSEDDLLSVWTQVLKKPGLRPDVSFFEQGGSSLSALNILSEYFNRHISMTLAEFYRAPTARAQAALLGADARPVPAAQAARETAPAAQTVFLTGATGFLGAHLLHALLEGGCPTVLCLLRSGGMERLLKTLSWYFGSGWVLAARQRMEVITGDVCMERFGLPEGEYSRLAQRVTAVYHAAADVRHYAADDALVATNLAGARQVIAFAMAAGAEMNHISTASVSGTRVPAEPNVLHVFTEGDLDIGQNWRDNLYIRSKFEAEQAVRRAMAEGLSARIFRVGRLVGRRSDGVFQKNPESNAFYRVVQGIGVLRAIPASLSAAPLELSPVDVCAEAILALAHAPGGVFHVVAPQPLPLGQALAGIFPELEVLPDEEFSRRLAQVSAAHGAALASLVDLWNGLRGGPDTVVVSSEKTHLLLRGAGFSWPGPELARALELFRPMA